VKATQAPKPLGDLNKAAWGEIVKRALGRDKPNPAPRVDVAAFNSSI